MAPSSLSLSPISPPPSATVGQAMLFDGARCASLFALWASDSGTPHLIMGDFNSLSPGDPFRASALLRYIVKLDIDYQKNPSATIGHPYLDFVVPAPLRIFTPLLRIIPRSELLCRLFDAAASLYAPRGCISLLKSAGYIDCFRKVNPTEKGFSCPSAAPAGRIDYIFASPELAQNLSRCYIPTEGNGTAAEAASDHLPVVAEFGLPLKKSSSTEQMTEVGEEVQV